MAKTPTDQPPGATEEKSFWDYHEEIEALKEERARVWRDVLGETVNDHAADDEVGVQRSIRAARIAELDPAVLAIDGQIRLLRMEQLERHAEPGAEESDAYHAARAEQE